MQTQNFPFKIFLNWLYLFFIHFLSIIGFYQVLFSLLVKFNISWEIVRTVTNKSVRKVLDWHFRKCTFETREPINVIDDGTVKLEFQHTFLLVLAWVLRVLSDIGNIARNFDVVIQEERKCQNKRMLKKIMLVLQRANSFRSATRKNLQCYVV